MTNVMIQGYNSSIVQGTVGTNGTLSEEFNLENYTIFGLLADNASNGTLNFLVANQSLSTGTNSYRLLRDSAGAAVAYTLPAGNTAFKESDIAVIKPYRFVRLLTSIGQASTPTFTFVVKA